MYQITWDRISNFLNFPLHRASATRTTEMKSKLKDSQPNPIPFLFILLISMIYSQIPQNKLDEYIPKRKYVIAKNTLSIWMITILVKFWIVHSLLFLLFSWAGFLCFLGPSLHFFPFLLQGNKTNLYQLLTTPINTRYLSQDTVH